MDLFGSDSVQAFFSGMTPKELHPDKAIYQPGMLRKVYNDVILYFMQNNIYTATCTCISYGLIILQLQKGKCKLGRITLFAEDSVLLQLESLGGFELPSTLSLDDEVFMYGAVVSQQQKLVHNGDFIRITSASQVNVH